MNLVPRRARDPDHQETEDGRSLTWMTNGYCRFSNDRRQIHGHFRQGPVAQSPKRKRKQKKAQLPHSSDWYSGTCQRLVLMGETMNRITNRPTCHQRSKNAFKTNSFLGMSVPTVHHEGKADRNLFTNYGSGVTSFTINRVITSQQSQGHDRKEMESRPGSQSLEH